MDHPWWWVIVALCVASATVAVPRLLQPHDPPTTVPDRSRASGALVAPSSSVPTTPPNESGAPRPTATATTFTPITVEAEARGNILSGSAQVAACSSCLGGGRVRYIFGASQLTIAVQVPVAGQRGIFVVYETDGPRTIMVNIDGLPTFDQVVTGPGWTTPETFKFTARVPAGAVYFTFYNDGPAPDIDRLTIR